MKLSVSIFVGFSIILLLFSITTYVNYKQSQEVKDNTEWVAVSQLVIKNSLRLQRNMAEMESALRGYIFTGDSSFLESYHLTSGENKQLLLELDTLVIHPSFQEEKIEAIAKLHNQWQQDFALPLIEAQQKALTSDTSLGSFKNLYKIKQQAITEKNLRGQIRNLFREFNDYEYQLRAIRKANLEASVITTRQISFALTTASIIIGLAIAVYITHRISNRIYHMINLADRIAKGNFTDLIADSKKDELNQLATSLNNMAKILNENFTALERKNQELDRFAYVVSHDLKAPLRGIENISNWIEEDYQESITPKLSQYLQLMRGRIKRMENLIDGILALSRIGREKKTLEKVDIGLLLQEIKEMFSSPDNGIRIHIQPNMPTLVTERIPLQQVFTNLISNAIKYHHRADGKVLVQFKEWDKYYEFSVIDDGPGIEPEYHEKIFIIFQTLKERDAFESTGVGLAIVKKILDDKKCTIKVISDINKGSTFVFTWHKEIA